MLRTIQQRIALPYLLLILVSMLGLGIYLSTQTRQSYLDNLNEDLRRESRLLAEALQPYLDTQPTSLVSAPSPLLQSLADRWAEISGSRVTLISTGGVVLADSDFQAAELGSHLDRPEVIQALQTGEGTSSRYSITAGGVLLYSAVAVQQDGQTVAIARLATPVQQINDQLANLQRALVGVALAAALLASLAAVWIANSTTRPLRSLTEAARRMAAGDFRDRLNPSASDETSDLARAFNHLSDVLAARISEQESERSKLNTVLQQMTDGVVIVDPQGRVQKINEAAEEMFVVSSASVVGRTLAEALRYHQVVDLWQHCRASGEPQSQPLELSADHLYLQAAAAPMLPENPGFVLLLFQNLTRTRYLETVRRDFVSNISHELRTPLASLKALTETLQEGALDDPPAAQRFLLRMETEVDALTQMVNELLELTRIESGRVPLKLRPVLPLEIIQPAAERLRLQADRAGLQVSLDCPEALPAVLADPVRLQQVVVNLLHNAIKFTPAGGRIQVTAASADTALLRQTGMPVGGCEPNLAVLFSVTDTGVGIHPDDLSRIFERFYKADRARSSGGTGLGLAIARHTVEAHGGRIWAQSLEGSGSTFFFCIPLA